jgi:ribonuclease HII
MLQPSYRGENATGYEVGLDEAGRGPVFGRVYAAAVIWPANLYSDLIRDSKTIKSAKGLRAAYDFIMTSAVAVSVAWATETEIDALNILQADMLAMHRALDDLGTPFDYILVDGNYFKAYKDIRHETVVKGDSKYYSIAAASIVAKYTRDKYINDLCANEPDLDIKYDLLKNKGYPTRAHLAGIQKHGIAPGHRKTFKSCLGGVP